VHAPGTLRFGLCCQFLDAPIRFRTATHRYAGALAPEARTEYLRTIAGANAASLLQAVEACAALGIGAFRINSQILPLGTHPVTGYSLESLDADGSLHQAFAAAGASAAALGIRLSFHPDQFVVLNSVRDDVVASSVRELDFQARLAALVGADTLVLHGGSMTGGRDAAVDRLARGVDRLSDEARARLALENDDRQFTPSDLLPLCRSAAVPLVYDAHHHRCHPDGLDVMAATDAAAETWGEREPWVHISSPRDGWSARNPRPHADYIDPADFPPAWLGRHITIDVEAKAKERAVVALMSALAVYAG
jgi:UV DNA damage endonuclease